MSFLELLKDSDKLTQLFYSKLFQRSEEYEAMFASEMSEQGNKFMKILKTVINNLYSLNDCQTDVFHLGLRHLDYGVKMEDYAVVGDVLIEAIAESIGDKFDCETEQAWRQLYSDIADMMKKSHATITNSVSA